MSAVATPSTSPAVIIIGAGFAGLSAAVRLSLAGRRVLVLEARPRLGGRATAFEDRVTGALVDNGQHVMFGCYRETLDFLRTIGAESHVRIQPALDVPFIDVRRRLTRLRCPDLPAPLHLLGGLIDWEALRWRDRMAAVRVWWAVRAAGRPSSPKATASVDQWLRSLKQTRRLRTYLWEPLAVAALNEPAEDASAEAFAQILALMFSGAPQNAAIVMPAVPLDRMYAEPARAFIEAHGGEVRTNALARVVADAAGVQGVRVGSETIRCGTVISSVPWNTFANQFDAMPPALNAIAAGAARVRSRPIVTANLWFDRPVMDDAFVGLPGGTIQWVFDKTAQQEDGCHLSCTVSGAVELVDRSNEEILRIAEADVCERLPRAAAATLVRGTVVRERHATFSTAQPDITRPAATTGLSGFFLAGDWIDTGLPSTIEGAVRGGRLAAEAVLASSSDRSPK
jgi:squalene-associated FAD-dependent desaturase